MIREMKDSYPTVSLERFCWLLGLSRQALYKNAWNSKGKGVKEHMVLSEVKNLRQEHPIIGTRKLHHLLQPFLKHHDIKMGRDALFSTLGNNKLLIRKRRRKIPTTWSNHWLKKYPNLTVGWHPQAPEQLWVADITYVPYGRNHLYLSLITDAYSHRIMGYHIADTLEATHCNKALQMAITNRCYQNKLIHHSDRGIQYCSFDYVNQLKGNGIEISMTQSGDPLENPVAERINGIIKNEYLKHYRINSLQDAAILVADIIERYNFKRPHQSIQLNTPAIVHKEKLLVNRQWNKTKRISSIVNQLNHL